MASLRDKVKELQEDLRDGIAWVAFWKEGRSWNAEDFHLEMGDYLYPKDKSRLMKIRETDPTAVVVNGYYSGYLGENMSLDELTAGVRHHYENGYSNIKDFIEAHNDSLSPEEIEKGRKIAHAAGLPFSEKPYRSEEDFAPYVYDGTMSIEDYELMQSMIEKERSERMAEPILSGYLSNLGKYTEGRPAGEWVTFPTTAEHLKEVFDRIGIDFKHYEEWHFTEYQSSVPGLTEHLSEYSHPDELNYLAKLLSMQFDDDREKFIAAIEYGDHTDSLQDIINLAQNLDCYWIYPAVKNEEDYGHYLVDELEEPELPEEKEQTKEIPVPDDTISRKEMQDYGYSWDGMLLLRQEAAEKLFSQDIEIFRIYEDGTERAVTDHSDLQEHAANGGIFGVEKDTWEAFYEYNAMKQELRESEPEKEALLLYGKEDTFGIYQLAHEERTRDLRFEPYDRLQAAGHTIDRANYELVYTAPLTAGTSLEDIFTRFNIDHPQDFKGHSLSVSDIVVLHQNGENTAHYVDSIGYKEVPEFLQEQQKQLTPDERETGEIIRTPRGTFYVTDMSREQMEAAGYGLHHQSEDGKYLIMGNGTRAFAIAAEPPEKANPLKTIEDIVEQNDNNFDGLINNTPQTPTVAELEQKAKAGEPISLIDYANAIKAEKEQGEKPPEKKPSIRAQLKAEKERAAQKKTAKTKNHDLEV